VTNRRVSLEQRRRCLGKIGSLGNKASAVLA
jgi:hypothetical protein